MPKNFTNHHSSSIGFSNGLEVEGIDVFIKNIEKHFFSKVTVREGSVSSNAVNLIVELDCNIELLEAIHHFEKNSWGNFNSDKYSFTGALNILRAVNTISIDIEELSLFLTDTSIIINRIYEQSISEQLKNIFSKLSSHLISLTKGLTEIPDEIYVPVFEEDDMIENESTLLSNIMSDNNCEKDYFSFWGIYHFSEGEDAVIYDLKNRAVINGELQMLNRIKL